MSSQFQVLLLIAALFSATGCASQQGHFTAFAEFFRRAGKSHAAAVPPRLDASNVKAVPPEGLAEASRRPFFDRLLVSKSESQPEPSAERERTFPSLPGETLQTTMAAGAAPAIPPCKLSETVQLNSAWPSRTDSESMASVPAEAPGELPIYRLQEVLRPETSVFMQLTTSRLMDDGHHTTSPSPVASSKSLKSDRGIRRVSHRVEGSDSTGSEQVTIDGRTYRVRAADSAGRSTPETEVRSRISLAAMEGEQVQTPLPVSSEWSLSERSAGETALQQVSDAALTDAGLMNLPTALSLVAGQHPAVAFARWRVQEAYAELDRAGVLWLPGIQAGFSFHRHDGNYQASNGATVDVNRTSFQFGLGAGAVGAGTTPRPGLVAQFHLADAIFEPQIARNRAWASGHAENSVLNRQLLDVAVAYTRLLDAVQKQRILEESRGRIAEVSRLTEDFAAAGQGLQSDADRLNTELSLVESRLAAAREATELASARLAHALSAEPGLRLHPMDATVVPLKLVSCDEDRNDLIQTGLTMRPELKELQALVAAACEEHRRQQYAPLVPSVLLGASAGGFGGGLGNSVDRVDDRYDFDAVVTWEIRNLGFGEAAARRRTESRLQQTMYRRLRMMDDVAREIAEAHSQVVHRRNRIEITQAAIRTASDSFERNLSRIRSGQGIPLEVLQSVRALEESELAYADAVSAFNEAQFMLLWATGWRVSLPQA